MMVDETEKKIMRQGLASGAYWNGNKWIPEVSDNDGLWTSMYGAGELMKYASLKRYGASDAVIKKAREQALKPLKAVLFTANAAGR